MKPDLLIVRHPHSGAPLLFAEYLNCNIINAGDGRHEHPTQALLDALTIKRRVGYLEGLKISICGDIANSRVARSNIHLLTIMGAEVRCVAPSTLMPSNLENLGVKIYGPSMAPVSKIRGRNRLRVLVKSPKAIPIQELIRKKVSLISTPRGVQMVIDVDPQSFY